MTHFFLLCSRGGLGIRARLRISSGVLGRGSSPLGCSVCASGSVVEHRLAKARVASSNLVFRSIFFYPEFSLDFSIICAIGGNGRRTRFRFWRETVGVQVPYRAPKQTQTLIKHCLGLFFYYITKGIIKQMVAIFSNMVNYSGPFKRKMQDTI